MTLAIVVGSTIVALGIIGALDNWRRERAHERALADGTAGAALGYSRVEIQAVALSAAIRAGGSMTSNELVEHIACHVIEDLDTGLLQVDELADALQAARIRSNAGRGSA